MVCIYVGKHSPMSAFWQSIRGPVQCLLPALVESHCSHIPMAMLLTAALQGSGGHGESRGKAAGTGSSLELEDPVKEQKSQIVECEETERQGGPRVWGWDPLQPQRDFAQGRAAMLRGVWSTEPWGAAEGAAAFTWGSGGSGRPYCSLRLLAGGWGEERSACVTASCTDAEFQRFFSAVHTPKAIVLQQECTCCLYTYLCKHMQLIIN